MNIVSGLFEGCSEGKLKFLPILTSIFSVDIILSFTSFAGNRKRRRRTADNSTEKFHLIKFINLRLDENTPISVKKSFFIVIDKKSTSAFSNYVM